MNDYPLLNLGDLVKPVQERMVDRRKWRFDKYIAGEHIDSGEVRIKKYGLIKGNEEVIGSAFHMCFRPGHVLYSTRRAYLRKAGIVDFEGICSNVTLVLQADEKKLLQSLLPFILQSEGFVQFAISQSIGSTNPFVKWTDLSKYKFIVPPLAIQKKISQMLWAVEDNVEKTENLVQSAEKLKKGLMQKLLTRGIGHTEYKNTPVGELPKEWQIDALPDLFKVIDYRGRTPPFSESGIPYIGSNNIRNDRIVLDERRYISEQTYEKYMTRGIPKEGDILLTTEAPLGEVAIIPPDFKFCFAQRLVALQCKKAHNPTFLMYMLRSSIVQKQLNDWATGTTVKGIAAKNMKFIRIPYSTDVEEQMEISKLLLKPSVYIEKARLNLSNLANLKRKLSNSFLSGELLVPKETVN